MSLRKLGKYKQRQTPCLLFTYLLVRVACIYSLPEKRVYNRFVVGSSLGWLVTVDKRSEMHIVNPITGEQIALPSVITMEQVKPIYNDLGAVHRYGYSRYTAKHVLPTLEVDLGLLQEYLHHKAFIFSDASTGCFIVVLIFQPFGQLSFARVGDDKWTWLPPHTEYEDCTYKDGLLYAVTLLGEIHAFDLTGPTVTIKIIMGTVHDFDCEVTYIVQAPWGDLLLVWRSKDFENRDYDADPATQVRITEEVKVYKVDTDAKRFVQINCLHDHVLFLGIGQSLCLNTEEYPCLNANHAYFTDDDEYLSNRKNNRRDTGVLDLDNNSRDNLVSPQLWSNCTTPVWFTPDLRMMKLALNKVVEGSSSSN
ncbi:hypothetical protein BRADI_4g30485v3 [Brachypodium distachyon]|uniref:KIB1-4 beta-propeller domain-containing protein n=1 Tax=Brachypodium distachyon TaxID=15368 RepID=A0A0Q3ES23_BRADI|nr:hypothetical protein BRADI_4g30485v3 [Brachypodium distachyon]